MEALVARFAVAGRVIANVLAPTLGHQLRPALAVVVSANIFRHPSGQASRRPSSHQSIAPRFGSYLVNYLKVEMVSKFPRTHFSNMCDDILESVVQ